MDYDALVLYGDVILFENQGFILESNDLRPFSYSSLLMEMDIKKLANRDAHEFIEISLEKVS